MEANILLSKVVSNPTDTAWAQAYSTLNLYIVLSVKSDATEEIAASGKELLEKIQREYFSQDEKNLENIRESVENAIAEIENLENISIALVTIKGEVLYIITVSAAQVVLKRDGKLGVIAEGEVGKIEAFSGKIKSDDIVIVETGDFSQKLPVAKLSPIVDDLEITELSENLAPIIHNEALGSEAAIILQYKKLGQQEEPSAETDPAEEAKEDEKDDTEETKITEKENKKDKEDELFDEPKDKKMKINMPTIGAPKFGSKKIIFVVILILVIILIGSIMYEKKNQETAKENLILTDILDPAQKKFDEANALASLNKGLALDEFTDLKKDVSDSESKLPAGSAARQKLDEFIGKIESKIGDLGAGATLANQKVIYDKGADLVWFDKDIFVAKSDGTINTLSEDGTSQSDASSKNNNVKSETSDDDSIYLLGDSGVTKTDKKSGKTTVAIKDISDTSVINTFGPNLYGLNTKTKTIDKYAGVASPRSDYFKQSVTLTDPSGMAIDGSIWIVDAGKIRKFTKGTEDTFTVTGITKDIGSNAQIFTSSDDTNIYVLDPTSTRILSIAKSGEVKNQYVSKDLANATSFTVDEGNKKIFVVISGKLYSFDM
ncbi:MAG TPA: hypothetical protein VG965_07245 [Patescibacteria group bacterium]|nr:hypothetical protein [Patescibacteria group bacterium]